MEVTFSQYSSGEISSTPVILANLQNRHGIGNCWLFEVPKKPAAAKALDVDASTVWRNLRRGHFWQLEETISGMRTLIRASGL